MASEIVVSENATPPSTPSAGKVTFYAKADGLLYSKDDAGNEMALSGAGDALTSGTLAQFAATTSLELKGVISDETGSGALVFATSPTLVTPTLGVAAATTVNKVAITAPATGSTLTIDDGFTLTVPANASVSGTNTGDQTITHTMGITIDGGGSVPATGSKGFVTIPFAATITNWYLAADASGSLVIDVKRSGTSIVGGGGNKPTLSTAQTGNAAVASWTSTAISAGDIIEFNLDSITTITRVNLVIKITGTT